MTSQTHSIPAAALEADPAEPTRREPGLHIVRSCRAASASTADRRARDRRRQLSRRPVRRLDDGRVRRRGAEGRASDRRRPDAPLRHRRPSGHDATLKWLSESRNKKSVTIDLRQPEGVELFLKLVAKSDVLIENFRPGTMEEWGLGWDDAERGQSRPRDAARLGLRPDRPLPPPLGLRAHRAGLRRPVLPRRLSGRDAGAARHGAARRLHRQPLRRDRHHDGAAPPREDRPRPDHRRRHLRGGLPPAGGDRRRSTACPARSANAKARAASSPCRTATSAPRTTSGSPSPAPPTRCSNACRWRWGGPSWRRPGSTATSASGWPRATTVNAIVIEWVGSLDRATR